LYFLKTGTDTILRLKVSTPLPQYAHPQLYQSGLFFIAQFWAGSCSDKPVADDEKKAYVLPDSLLKTIEIDTVSNSRVTNTLTLTGKVNFHENNVIKMFPAISGLVSDIRVMPGDYVKLGEVLAVMEQGRRPVIYFRGSFGR
jgi:cobalt-zinc-cadmium efflux system membrane fusion protein